MTTHVRHNFARRGVVVVYTAVFLIALLGMISLAVDWGRAQTAKTEMQDACDAAARYAVAGLTDGTYLAKAQQAAAQNTVDGDTLTLLAADVEAGSWDNVARAFVLNGTPRNTVRITGQRTIARGNAVPLLFGRIIGANSVDVTAKSVARQSSLAAVGINSITFTGSGLVRRRATESGGGIATASNGTYAMSGTSVIYGDALYRTAAPTGTVSGRKTLMSSDVAFAAQTVPVGATTVTGDFTLNYNQGIYGNYAITGNLLITSGGVLTLYGDTAIYVGASCTINGTAQIITNGYRVVFYLTGNGAVSSTSSNNLAHSIYAPNSAVTIGGSGMVGSVVGSTLSINSTIDYTSATPIPVQPSGGGDAVAAGGVATVK